MNTKEFVAKVNNKEIKNGSKFYVYDSSNVLIGAIGVIDTTVVYLDIKEVPVDLFTGDYNFDLIEEE